RARATSPRRARARRPRPPPSPERLLAPLAPVEDGDRLVADLARELRRSLYVTADVHGLVRVGGERDRHSALMAGGQQLAVGVELADRFVQPGRGNLDADARCLDRVRRLDVQVVRLLVRGAHPEEL